MKKRNWRTLLATIIMVLPFVLGLGSMTDVMASEVAVPDEQLVTLHKLGFKTDANGNSTLPSEEPNDGDKIPDYGDKVESVPLAGATFEAYDVTATYWAAYDGAKGTDADKTKAAEDAVKALKVKELTAYKKFGPTSETDGTAADTLPTKSGGRNAIYLFHETISPDGVVQSKSADFILGLPVYNDGTDTPKENIHIYPKNEVKVSTLEFTKMGVDERGILDILLGAEFILKGANGMYYNSETGEFDITDATAASHIKSGNDGKVSVSGLILAEGDYSFYEVDSSVSKGEEQTTDGDQVYHYNAEKNPVVTAHVSPDMEVTYDYYDDNRNKVTDQPNASAYNYKAPVPTKEANDHDVDQDQEITFTITQKIPTDIADYTQFQLVDDFDDSLELLSTVGEIEGQLTDFGGKVTVDGSKFTVDFDMALLKAEANAGKTITFVVKMSVKKGAELATDINNEVTFDNNFDNQSAKDSVKTYGKKFVKQDADTSKTLAKAQFVVKKGNKYLMIDGNGKHSWSTSKEDAFKFTSDENGKFEVLGLAKTAETGDPVDKNGDIVYELEEVVAPDGYALLKDTIKFAADNGVEILPVVNKHKGSLPSTGGKGIVAFVAVGVVAIAGAGLYFMKGRKHIEG